MNDAQTDSLNDQPLVDALRSLLEAECTPAVVRAHEAGGPNVESKKWAGQNLSQSLGQNLSQNLSFRLAESGFEDALLPEADGGAGLSLARAFPLFELCGRYLLPVPLPERMVARAGGSATSLEMTACLNAAKMAGAMQKVLEMSLQFANDRQQFGRPLAKFQAIQHQLAVMAEQVTAARMAAQLGCQSRSLQPATMNVAVAKARTNEAAVEVAALAHSIFGAIGFTAEHDLQLYTRQLHAWRQSAGTESYWHELLGQAVLQSPHAMSLDILQNLTATH